MVWIFCPEMTPAQFPKSDLWNFCWIFCPEMTLAQFPEFGFFVQNSRIGVKHHGKQEIRPEPYQRGVLNKNQCS